MIYFFLFSLVVKTALGSYIIYLARQEPAGSRSRLYAYAQAVLFFADSLILSIAIYYLSGHPNLTSLR